MPSYCAVFGCKNNSKYPERYVVKNHVTFLRFHSCNHKYFDVWTQRINRKGFKVTRSTKVCSNHFQYAQPFPCNPHPSLYLKGYNHLVDTPKRRPPTPQNFDDAPVPKKRRKEKKPTHRSLGVQVRPEDFNGSVCHDHIYTYAPQTVTFSSDYVRHLEERIEQQGGQLEQVNTQLKDHQEEKRQYVKSKPKMTWLDIAHSDSLAKLYTGLPSYAVLQWLLCKLETGMRNLYYCQGNTSAEDTLWHIKNSTKSGTKRSQPVQDELLMVLMKLRLNCSEEDLAFRFGVSTSTVSEVLATLIPFLSKELGSYVCWPTRDEVLKYYPQCFKIYDGVVRCIIDCTEIHVHRPSLEESNLAVYSQYKSNPTIKFLIGIAPSGAISFVSKPIGGSASNKQIVKMTNIVELFSEGDICMADHGFNVKDLLLKKGVRLEIPPFQNNLPSTNQFTDKDNVRSREEANARIHVERAIGRLKEFRLMSGPVSLSMKDMMEDASVICAALVNLQPILVPLSR